MTKPCSTCAAVNVIAERARHVVSLPFRVVSFLLIALGLVAYGIAEWLSGAVTQSHRD